jgi:hypothetical protein
VVVGVALHGADAGVIEAPYSTEVPVIDGLVTAAEWSRAKKYDVTMQHDRSPATHPATLYFSHDASRLYIGFLSNWGSSWNVYWKIYFDGDHDHACAGNLAEPHIDVSCDQPAPTGWPGYDVYCTHLEVLNAPVVPEPVGTEKASAGGASVSYEAAIVLADLGAAPGDTVGFMTYHGTGDRPNEHYAFPAFYKLNPEYWLDLRILPQGSQGGGGDGGGTGAPVPEPAGLLLFGAALLARRRSCRL